MSRRHRRPAKPGAVLEITRDENLCLQVSAALNRRPKPARRWSPRCNDRARRPDNQVAERFRRAAFTLIQTGAWSLVFSHPLT
jgi:hypothetical protein